MQNNGKYYWYETKCELLKIAQKAGLPESPEELTKRITRGFIVELLNVVIINPIIQVGNVMFQPSTLNPRFKKKNI